MDWEGAAIMLFVFLWLLTDRVFDYLETRDKKGK